MFQSVPKYREIGINYGGGVGGGGGGTSQIIKMPIMIKITADSK